MKNKPTKRALLASALAVMLCVTMLVGTTLAWFTDDVTAGRNTIQSGNLDVVLEYWDGNSYKEVTPTTKLFNDAALWEPGYTEVAYLKVSNAGSLALKYQLSAVVFEEILGKTKADAEIKLSDYLVFKTVESDTNLVGTYATREAAVAAAGTVMGLNGYNGETKPLDPKGGANADDYVALIIYMPETVGNEANHNGTNVPSIELGVNLLATQLTAEKDSFDNQYDKDAEFAIEVKNAEELATALRTGGLVKLANDISVTETLTVPAGVTVNLDLNGKTITGTKGRDAGDNRIHVIVNNGILTIKDGTVKSAGNDGGSAIYNNAGATLTIEDVTLYGAPQSDPVYEAGVSKPFPSYAVNNYGNAVVNGATVKSYHGAIATGGDGVTVINDADIDVGLGQSTGITSYAIYSYENAQVTVNDGKFAFTKQEIYVNGGNTFCELGTNPIMINGGNYIGTSFSTGAGREYVIKGGTFDKDPSAYVANGYEVITNADGTYTVQLDTATGAEIKDQLNDNTTSNIIIGETVDLSNSAYQNGGSGNITFKIKDGKTLDLNNNSIIRPDSGSGSGVEIPEGATTTVKNGSIISEGDMTSVDVASGATATFEKMEFVGNGSSFLRVRANTNAKTTLIFRECSFTNATVEITGMNGACEVDVQFIGCTFDGSYKMYDENGNLLTDPHGHVHYTTELFTAASNYVYGSFTFDDCTFDYDAHESSSAMPVIELYGPNSTYGKTLTVTLKDVTVTGKDIIPVGFFTTTYKNNVSIVEEGTNSYTNNGSAVNYDGSAK